MKLRLNDEKLLRNYIECESYDYNQDPDYVKGMLRTEWIDKHFNMIMERTKDIENTDILTIKSYTNMGQNTRSLKLDVFSGTADINVVVDLCSCGCLNHTCLVELYNGKLRRLLYDKTGKKYEIDWNKEQVFEDVEDDDE